MVLPTFYVVAVVGFNQTVYTVEEGDGTVEVCAAFLQPTNPSQIAPNITVELMGSTSLGTYSACYLHNTGKMILMEVHCQLRC